MNIHCCSFASESFTSSQVLQTKFFKTAGFDSDNIHLYNPKKLKYEFFEMQPNASELNKFGWYSFKPFLILSILEKLKNEDILFYLDVNDKPLYGIKAYLSERFSQNKNLDLLGILTNYPNFKYLSKFNKENLSIELLLSSLLNFQPEAGAIAVKNSKKSRSILWTWYYLTLTQSYATDLLFDIKSRHDQESFFILSRLYKSIKLESWFWYKLTGRGLRKYIEFESFR